MDGETPKLLLYCTADETLRKQTIGSFLILRTFDLHNLSCNPLQRYRFLTCLLKS